MAEVAWDTSNLVVLTNISGNTCTTCCNSMASECEWCVDTQPAWIKVPISGIGNCGCLDDLNGPIYTDVDDLTSEVNNTFTLLHIAGCVYRYTENYDETVGLNSSLNADCSDPFDRSFFDSLIVKATLQDGSILIEQYLMMATVTAYTFSGTITYTGDDACGDTSNTATNDKAGCLMDTSLPLDQRFEPTDGAGIASVSLT